MVTNCIVLVQLHLIITMDKADVNWKFLTDWSPSRRYSRSLAQKKKRKENKTKPKSDLFQEAQDWFPNYNPEQNAQEV